MRIILAPMEGVMDAWVREILTSINPYDLCVTEVVRVMYSLLPKKTFYRLCPELHNGGKTRSGVPVRVQLLGQSPEWLAENAARAVALGSPGVDLNCGCPAKTVTGSCGGASLLKDPELIYQATRAMRSAVPAHMPVTVKIRLGWDDSSRALEIAQGVEAGGATELTVHGRTKVDGYKAERIDWPAIATIRSALKIPVIANGEIWDAQSANACMATTGCNSIMVGRGALHVPNLGQVIKHGTDIMPWSEVIKVLQHYVSLGADKDQGNYYPARIKQWLGTYLRKQYPEAETLFQEVRVLKTASDMITRIVSA